MPQFDLVIFDLDGTLIDSKLDIAHSVNATLAYMGKPPLQNEIVYSYVGHGAPVLIQRVLGEEATEEECAKALKFFVEYYHEHRVDYTTLYPGAQETIDSFLDAGVRMAVLTNKPARISEEIVKDLGVSQHFIRVYGGNTFDEKKPHPIGILKLLEETGIAPERTLMVGDSSVDIETAYNAGVGSCGMLYGFKPESLQDPKPQFLLEAFSDLKPVVLG